jgi:ParB-like nuclease domain
MELPPRILKLPAPLEQIEWRNPHDLDANLYNPNVVVSKEMELLKLSILQSGWIQPVLISPDGLIIDGFHRCTIARIENWLVPCCVLDLDEKERMLLTVRINRAKGTHVALRMSDLVQKLIALGCAESYIAEQIGATEKEIEILKKGDIFKNIDLSNWQYSTAWLPKPYIKARAPQVETPETGGPAAE